MVLNAVRALVLFFLRIIFFVPLLLLVKYLFFVLFVRLFFVRIPTMVSYYSTVVFLGEG